MIYLETNSTNPYYNLAFEEYVLMNRKDDDYLILWQNDNTIVVGQNQNTEEEINRSFVEEHQISVVRRGTGGGAVYHDLGNLNYSFITDAGNLDEITIARFTEPVVKALQELGLQAEASGRNDILVDGKKVSGTAQRISGGRILHHGTLLFDSNADMIAGALHADPEKFKSKSTKSVRSRVGNIRDSLKQIGKDMESRQFWTYLLEFFSRDEISKNHPLSEEELEQIKILKQQKYDTWEWNFGKGPKYDYLNKKRFSGGTLEVRFSIQKGRIKSVKFYGDFLSVRSLEELEEALSECYFREEEISPVLEKYQLNEFFGTITKDEILSLLK